MQNKSFSKIFARTLAILLLIANAWFLSMYVSGNNVAYSFNFNFQKPAVWTSNIQQSAADIVKTASPAVVYINGYRDVPSYTWRYAKIGNFWQVTEVPSGENIFQQVTSGSGFFITSDGYILTNKHVVSDSNTIYKIDYGGKGEVDADVVYRDPNLDLAIVKISGSNYPTLSLGDSSALKVGQDVIAIGNAFGRITDFATSGEITSLSKSIVVSGEGSTEKLNGVIQSTAKLYPGDSGGPLIDSYNQVIAVNTATTVGKRISYGYSIPINLAKSVISKAGINI